jgi:protease IV
MVMLRGLGRVQNYYRDLFDRIGVQVNFIRVGRFKSAGEPFISNAPSPEALEADAYWMDAAWAGYVKDVEQARRLPEGALMRLIAELPARLAAAQGNLAQLAVSEHLVDGLKTRDELRALMIERGTKEASNGSFRQIALANYRATVKEPHGGAAVGVIVAAGEIFDDAAPPGRIGGRSTAELVRQARENDDIKAIVLRVDSPGGSTFGSELIRRELEVTRAAGKPVVVSMSDVAASGGYWIATAADEIFADAGTITGSIGIFSILPTVDGALDRLGVHTGGHTTTWVAGADDPRRPLDPRMAEVVRAAIGNGYREFIGHVARARKLPEEQVEQIAQGRVWTGAQAKDRGLVDTLGGLRAAIGAAAARAQLGPEPTLIYVERDP